MGGKSRKTGGVSKKLIERLKNLKRESVSDNSSKKEKSKSKKIGLGIGG